MREIEIGAVLEGRVTGITKFGAFVTMPGGKSGLVHISEVANAFVTDVHDFLTEGQTVRVKVMDINAEGRIALSLKRAEERPAPAPRPERSGAAAQRPAPPAEQTFEDKLKQYMQDANSRMSGNKLFEQQRRPRGRRR